MIISIIALYAIESNQNHSEDEENGAEYAAVRKISATEEIPDEVKNWLTETFVRGNVIKNIGMLLHPSNLFSKSQKTFFHDIFTF